MSAAGLVFSNSVNLASQAVLSVRSRRPPAKATGSKPCRARQLLRTFRLRGNPSQNSLFKRDDREPKVVVQIPPRRDRVIENRLSRMRSPRLQRRFISCTPGRAEGDRGARL
jgi:hypothetical protein